MSSTIYKLNGLTDREAIADALYRAVLAYDLNDKGLLKSSMTKDAVFAIPSFEMEIKGIENIEQNSLNTVGPLVTGHLVGNVRIQLEDGSKTALMSASSINQHIRPKQQESEQNPPNFMVGTYNELQMRKEDDDIWKIAHWTIRPLWRSGDPAIVAGN